MSRRRRPGRHAVAVALLAATFAAAGPEALARAVPPAAAGAAVGAPVGADPTPLVEDLTLPVEDLTFTEGSLDGALTDTGHRDFRLSADVLFAFDKATLTPRATELLTTVAATLREQGATRATVTGFTDSVGSDAYNLGLSRRRADAVVTALRPLTGGSIALTAAGRGETAPIAENVTKAGQALNRRVEIRAG